MAKTNPRPADRDLSELAADPANPRVISDENLAGLEVSVEDFGDLSGIVFNTRTGQLVTGHQRVTALRRAGATRWQASGVLSPSGAMGGVIVHPKTGEQFPIRMVDWDEPTQRIANLVANNPAVAGAFTAAALEQVAALEEDARFTALRLDALQELLAEQLEDPGPSSGGDGRDGAARSLTERFGVPPFSVLDARQGYWLDRKRAWIAQGIESGEGRSEGLTFNPRGKDDWVSQQIVALGRTSIFDPVLSELAYRWFSPPTGTVLDPFAGGSVRGIVASALGRIYTGIELRTEQVDANRAQAERVRADGRVTGPTPNWILGDAINLRELAPDPVDFLFSCPPYGNLEVYSKDPRDLSTMTANAFLVSYRSVIHHAVAALKPDRFACFVVCAYRDSGGFFIDLAGETVAAFEAAGARLYNEAVLVTPVGTARLRAAPGFTRGLKLQRCHQNVLVFCKGNAAAAAAAVGPVDFGVPEADPTDDEPPPLDLVHGDDDVRF